MYERKVEPVDGVLDPATIPREDLARATRDAWIAVADTYDPHDLIPLWCWTTQKVKEQAVLGVDVGGVVAQASYAMACAIRCCGGTPSSVGEIRLAWDRLPDDVGWPELQAAVEGLALAWEAVAV